MYSLTISVNIQDADRKGYMPRSLSTSSPEHLYRKYSHSHFTLNSGILMSMLHLTRLTHSYEAQAGRGIIA